MTEQQLYGQVASILEANSLGWNETSDGVMYLRFSSAGVSIEVGSWGSQAVVQISSSVLTSVGADEDCVLREVNRLNVETQFGRWVFYPESRAVCIEYFLLGDNLQEVELMTILAALARAADYHDDSLQEILGGRRAFEQ
ncbi:hypothetical protein MU0083_000552 [[Mycobacterium] kokjensenii]|uniref:TY-Chap central domain-containing protein n=1 Tax=[Mycobacterium] kokjensenii TaxID=3064287 RepID=A0ABN9MRU5_9MYCO|nr:hypothetical protein [Mycolicibacter sp. MU0083]CAJ1493904.1 hypothetical protein MU0083_000552 [Mycolicibacter sp. MU0083]